MRAMRYWLLLACVGLVGCGSNPIAPSPSPVVNELLLRPSHPPRSFYPLCPPEIRRFLSYCQFRAMEGPQ